MGNCPQSTQYPSKLQPEHTVNLDNAAFIALSHMCLGPRMVMEFGNLGYCRWLQYIKPPGLPGQNLESQQLSLVSLGSCQGGMGASDFQLCYYLSKDNLMFPSVCS